MVILRLGNPLQDQRLAFVGPDVFEDVGVGVVEAVADSLRHLILIREDKPDL